MLLLMLLTGVGGVKAQATYKLEEVTKVEAGGLYVFEQSGYVMTTVSSKVLQITKTYKTTGLKGSENYVFTLESATASDKETPGFKMKNMSLSSNQYIGNKSSSTDMTATSVDAAAVWAFNFQDDQTVLIQNLNNNNRFLGFNNATTPTGYKAYAASNMSANPHAIVVYKLVEESSLSSAGLAFAENSYTATLGETFTAPQLTNPNNLPVTYASSDANVATVAADGSVTLVGAGTTTITASFAGNDTYAAGSANYTLTVVDPNAPGTENNPFTIEQAIAYINSDSYNASDVVYVMGIISQIDSYNSNYKSITYWISDDGTDKNQFECYSGRGLDNSDFNSVEDLEQGDVVVVCGTVKKYSTIYEFNYNNYIVSLTRKTTPTLSFAEETYSVVKNGNMTISATTNSDGTISYESSDPDVAEIDASTGVVTAKAAGTTTITATVAATDTYKAATATVELTVTAPKHKATFYQNGEKLSEAEFTEDATIEFPDAMATILGKQFVGWLPAEIEGTTNEASPIKAATMGTADVTYYAVYAYVEGEEKSSTLTNGDIKEYFTKEKPSYGTLKSYSDEINGVTWSASCNADAAGRPWIQIKKEADAYFKVNVSST